MTTRINRMLVALVLVAVFTSGGLQVGPATGPLEAVFELSLGLPSVYLLALGYPISFNKMMISSIVRAGLVGGSSDSDGVSTTKTVYTVGTWVGSMAGRAVISFALYHTLVALPGLG